MRSAHEKKRDSATLGALLATVLLAVPPAAFGLSPVLDVSQYAHTAWTIRQGFSKGTIVAIAQGLDGYLWLGTEFGLLRFDGVRSVPWQPPNGQLLPSSYIRSLLTARDGTLWIGTSAGLAGWKSGKLTRYTELDGQSIQAILEDRDGAVWTVAHGLPSRTLCAIQKGNVQCHGADGRFGGEVDALYEDRAGNLWIGGVAGLWKWKPGPPKLYPMPDRVLALMEADSGALVITMYSGIRQFVDGRLDAYPHPAAEQRLTARAILRDRNGGMWIGTADRGLVHAHQGRADTFDRSDGLTSDFIETIFEDREGNIWVATIDGLDQFRDLAVPRISVKQGLSNAIVKSILAARDGSMWLGTNDGLCQWNRGSITVYRRRSAKAVEPGAIGAQELRGLRGLSEPRSLGGVREITAAGLPDDSIESLYQDAQDRIWVATRRGVAFLENGRFTPVSTVPGEVKSIAGDRTGNIWISQNASLFHWRGGNIVEQIPWAKLGHQDPARILLNDPLRGGLWLAFLDGGVMHFRDGQVVASYTKADGLAAGRSRELELDREGTLWISTEGGLSRLKDAHIATLSSRNGLPCDDVQWITEDDNQSFWLYMPCGLVRIARSQMEAWVSTAKQDPLHQIQTTVFDSSDGVRSHTTGTGYSPSVAKSDDGKLWFLPWDGVSVIDPLHLPFNSLPPPVHIEAVKIDGEQVEAADGMALAHRTKDIEIDYTALSLSIPERVRFRYKLEGKDTEWHDAGTRRQAYYNDLAPRKYSFRVAARNNDGVWNEAGAAWNFTIVPAFYQTLWFQGLATLAGIGMLWLLYRLRLRQATARVNLLYTERLAERTRIARDLHDTLLQSLAGVSLQLDGIAKQAVTAPEKTPSLISHVRDQVDSCFREARVKVWNLRSPLLEVQGLEGALRQFVERIGPAISARCDVTVSGQRRSCPPDIEEELLHIAQEATNNANRHAQSKAIRISLEYGLRSLTLSISDDGRGFNLEEGYGKAGHWGLKNMHERAAQIRGTCKITTAVGQGTLIEIRVPMSSWSLRNPLAKHNHSSSGSR